MKAPHFVAIAGASCSGKTSLARYLSEALPGRTPVIGLDSYYYDLSHLPPERIVEHNLDEPSAIEHELLVEHVAALARGESIHKPVYDHKTHSRCPHRECIEPGTFLIVEGLFALYWEELRRLVTTPIFIEATQDLCLQRRIVRDRSRRGRTAEEVTRRYHATVAPMFERYVLPTQTHAEIIVDGAKPIESTSEQILAHIMGNTDTASAGRTE